MDTEKLLRILKDVQQDEQDLTLASKIDTIKNSVAQNNPSSFSAAQEQLTDLLKQVRETAITYGYSHTETLLLKKIGGAQYFGKGLSEELEAIFSGKSFELVAKIDELRTQRNEFIKKAQRLATGLTDIGIQEYRPSEYEVGIVLPMEEADLDKLGRRMRDIKLLLSALSEASGTTQASVKITRLSNGSLEFFSLQPYEVAVLLSTLLLNVSMIWDKVAQFKKKIGDTEKDPLLSDEAKGEIKKALEKETAKIKKEILEELPDKFIKGLDKKIEAGRKNEIRNQVRVSVRAIFAWFEAGIEIDITPIRVTNGTNEPEKNAESVRAIEQTNQRLGEIYRLPPEVKKLPFTLPDEPEATDPVKK